MTADPAMSFSKSLEPAALVSGDELKGRAIYGRDGEKLGAVHRIILGKRSGQILFVVLATGGVFGLGANYRPVPWSAFRFDEEQDRYFLVFDKHMLEGSPSFSSDSAPLFDAEYGIRVIEYFRPALDGEL